MPAVPDTRLYPVRYTSGVERRVMVRVDLLEAWASALTHPATASRLLVVLEVRPGAEHPVPVTIDLLALEAVGQPT